MARVDGYPGRDGVVSGRLVVVMVSGLIPTPLPLRKSTDRPPLEFSVSL